MKCSVSDPDFNQVSGSVSGSESRSGFRRAKLAHKSSKNLKISFFAVLDVLF
jgi:hypothetical protein